MIRNLRKLFGADESLQADQAQAAARPRNDHTAPAHVNDGHSPVTSSTIGQTLIVTLVDSDLNAFKAADINHEIRRLFEAHTGVRNLVLDMENIKFLDSAGLNTFVDLIAPVRQRGGTIAVAAACQQVEVLFKLTRLELIFKIRRTTMEAINAVEVAG